MEDNRDFNELEAEEKDQSDVKISGEGELMEWIKSIAIAVAIAMFIKTFIFNTTYVIGSSMYPTLEEKDRLIATKIGLYLSGPSRGDIVLLDAPDAENKKYVKRVIGLEGDLVEVIDGRVYLNGEELDEAYIEEDSYTHTYDEDSWLVGKDQAFVLGDNRLQGASKDSRYFGCIDTKSIKGITRFRYYPFGNSFGKVQ